MLLGLTLVTAGGGSIVKGTAFDATPSVDTVI